MARQRLELFRTVQRFLNLAASCPCRFYTRKWLNASVLALLTAFCIGWDFQPPIAGLPDAYATDSQIAQNLLNAQALLEQGRKLYEAGQYSEAAKALQQAVEAFQDRTDVLGQAIALSNLCLAFKQLGQWDKAETAITQSLNLLNNSGLKTQDSALVLAQTLDVQGSLQLERGKTQQALNTWKQAANTYAQVGDEVGRIRSVINQAQAQQTLGFYRQARATLEQVNQTLEKQPDSLIKATALRSLGDILQLIGELGQSLKVLQQSYDVAQRLQSSPEIAAALLSLGNTERALGNRARTQQDMASEEKPTPLHCINRPSSGDALKYYQQAAQYYQKAATTSASPLTQIQAKLNRLSVLLELQNWSEAQNLWPSIQSQLTQIPASETSIHAQINLSQSLACLKQTTAANTPSWREIAKGLAIAIQQAQHLDDQRSEAYALGVLGGLYLEARDLPSAQKLTEQALLLAQTIKAADIAYLWEWQLGHLLRSKGNITGAIASYTEAVNTLKLLRSDLVALNPDVQFSFRDNVEPVYRQFVDLLLQPGDKGLEAGGGKQGGDSSSSPLSVPSLNSQSSVSQQHLKQARELIEALQLTELENFFREVCLVAKPKQIDQVVDQTDTTAAVIYPIILKDRLEIILKLPNQSELRHYTTHKSQSEIERTLDKLQQYLREPDRINDVKKLSQQVYSWLIQPLEAELRTRQIKTLVFVLDGYLRNIPMGVLYDEQKKQYLLEKYAISLAPSLQLVDPKPLQREQLDALITGVSEQREIEGREFAPLKNVALELNKIKSEVPKSKELLNQTFTKLNLQNQIGSARYSIVHMATHGEFSSNPEETFILTWEQLLKVKDFDTLLRLSDQSPSRVIELLVLSACQTAAGDKRAALGLAGIAVRAGARSTVATLWSVDDRSTAELMSQFYQELKNNTVTKAEALRRAQLALLSEYEIPYFWAPYLLVGNWL